MVVAVVCRTQSTARSFGIITAWTLRACAIGHVVGTRTNADMQADMRNPVLNGSGRGQQVGLMGFEPTTFRSGGERSIH